MIARGILVLLSCAALAWSAPERRQSAAQAKQRELELLRMQVASARDSLQNEIAARWSARQRSVEQRESDKEEIERLRETQERAYSELARIKEELFSAQRRVEDERVEQKRAAEELELVNAALGEIFQRESEAVLEQFPLDAEQRRRDLETARTVRAGEATPRLTALIDYLSTAISRGMSREVRRERILADRGDLTDVWVARFGNLFGYAVGENGDLFTIRQTGLLGTQRYGVTAIESPELRNFLSERFPRWIEQRNVDGPVLLDVLHNSQSLLLISGQRIDARSRIIAFFRAGGPVMVPLLVLPLWALALIAIKLVHLLRTQTRNRSTARKLIPLFTNSDTDRVHDCVKNQHGAVASVVRACFDMRGASRETAEKRVREILIEEVPRLDKHLSTVAVIAGVAPLLGLLGTVTGMIRLFEVITHYGTGDPKLLAGGISEALITTQTGLIIAIPLLLIHNSLRSRADRIMAELEKHALSILNRLWPE